MHSEILHWIPIKFYSGLTIQHNFGLLGIKLGKLVFPMEEWNSIILEGNLPHWGGGQWATEYFGFF